MAGCIKTICYAFLTLFSILLPVLVSFYIQHSSFHPLPLLLPALPPKQRDAPHLKPIEKLGEGVLDRPEDVAVDYERRVVYTATQDGWIKRMLLSNIGSSPWQEWMYVGGHPLGITGLLNVTNAGIENLSSSIDGVKFLLTDEVVVSRNGMIYFTDASSKYGLENWILDVLEARPHGRLLQYNPSTHQTSLVLGGLSFANGVALSKEEDFLVVCETWKFRCLKYWLEGERKGSTEILIDNLPGGPDNIHSTGNGSFWLALVGPRSPILHTIYKYPLLKHLVVRIPYILNKVKEMQCKGATVIKIGENGQEIERYTDPKDGSISFVTSALEIDGHLYIGSLATNFIARFKLV